MSDLLRFKDLDFSRSSASLGTTSPATSATVTGISGFNVALFRPKIKIEGVNCSYCLCMTMSYYVILIIG